MSNFWDADPVAQPSAAPVPFWQSDPVVGSSPSPPASGIGAIAAGANDVSAGAATLDPTASAPSQTGPLSPQQQSDFDQFLAARTARTDPVANQYSNALNMGKSMVRGIPFSDRAIAGVQAAAQGVSGQTPDYSGNLGALQADAAASMNANPAGEIVGNAAGGAALPLGMIAPIARGATLGAKVLGGAAVGAGYGALQGVSNAPNLANVGDDARRAAVGAVTGAGLGAAFPAAAAGIGAGYRAVAGQFVPAVDGVGSAALGGVNKMIDASGGQPVVSRTLAKLGPDAQLLDASPALTQLAGGVATGPPGSASNSMVTGLQARQAAAPARIGADIDTAMGPFQDAQQATDALDQQKAAIRSALPSVYQNAPAVDIQPVLSTIDSIKAADGTPLQGTLANIRQSLTQDASAAIPTLPANPTAAQFRAWQQATATSQQAGGRVPVTDAETLTRAKETIDGYLNYGPRGMGPLAGADAATQGLVGDIRGQLNDAIRQQVPGYAQTMDKLASINQQQQAIQTGAQGSLLGGQSAVSPYTFDRDWQASAQTPTNAAGVGLPQAPGSTLSQQQTAQQLGMRDAMERAVGTKTNDLAAVRNILQGTPDPSAAPGSTVGAGYNLQNIGTAYGPSAAQTLADALARENKFAASNSAVYQGSQTGARLAGQQAAKGPRPFQIPGEFHNITGPIEAGVGAIHGAANWALRALQSGNPEAYQSQVSSMLSAPSGSVLLGQVLANNAARRANTALAAPVTNAATRALGVPAAVLGEALAQSDRRRQVTNAAGRQ